MPLYNFKARFIRKVLVLLKTHTIRERRKNPTKVGDRLYLYVGSRTKDAFKFAEAVCCKVEGIRIFVDEKKVYVWKDSRLEEMDVVKLAKDDGFETVDDFFDFFKVTYKKSILDGFEIVHWDPKTLVREVYDIPIVWEKYMPSSEDMIEGMKSI